MTGLAELLDGARRSKLKLVEITGGEPALHPATVDLAQMLVDDGFEVLMETNGTVLLDKFPPQVKRIIDVKLPSSGMNWIDLWHLDQAGVPLIFSVVFGRVKPEELVQWMLESQRSYLRFQLQMHKFIWPPEMRGV